MEKLLKGRADLKEGGLCRKGRGGGGGAVSLGIFSGWVVHFPDQIIMLVSLNLFYEAT